MATVESAAARGWPSALRRLIGLPVRIEGIDVGRTADVVLDRAVSQVLGFVVDVRGAHRQFLPWVAARVEEDHVATLSILSLLSSSELAFYLDNGSQLIHELREKELELAVDRQGQIVPTPLPTRLTRRYDPVPEIS